MIYAAVHLTPRAEEAFRREAERVGAYVIDRNEAVQRSAAATFENEAQSVLEAVGVRVGSAQA